MKKKPLKSSAQGAEESNSTEISVKFTVSMRRRSILLFKAPYVTSALVIRSCYASGEQDQTVAHRNGKFK